MLFLDRQRCVGSDDLPDEMGQVITKCVMEDSYKLRVPKLRDKLQVTSYKTKVNSLWFIVKSLSSLSSSSSKRQFAVSYELRDSL